MKKALLVGWMALVAGICMSCGGPTATPSSEPQTPPTVTMEGHDYFKVPGYGVRTYSYAHKGNCRACEERWRTLAAAIALNAK